MLFDLYIVFRTIILPPGIIILALLLSLYLFYKRPNCGKYLLITTILIFYLLSTNIIGSYLHKPLYVPAMPTIKWQKPGCENIVILGGGIKRNASEYGKDTASTATLERIALGAQIARSSKLPIAVSGGRPLGTDLSEAEAMANILQDQYGLKPYWIEAKSLRTIDQAKWIEKLLPKASNICLVTHMSHMKRAKFLFEQKNFTVTPAALSYPNITPLHLMDFIPSISGLSLSSNAIREYLAWILTLMET